MEEIFKGGGERPCDGKLKQQRGLHDRYSGQTAEVMT